MVASNWSNKYLEKDVPKKTEEIIDDEYEIQIYTGKTIIVREDDLYLMNND